MFYISVVIGRGRDADTGVLIAGSWASELIPVSKASLRKGVWRGLFLALSQHLACSQLDECTPCARGRPPIHNRDAIVAKPNHWEPIRETPDFYVGRSCESALLAIVLSGCAAGRLTRGNRVFSGVFFWCFG